ncbi:cobaltochelatase CobT-related protein [Gallicola sp. Sow4_E12]|uniref:cobaltochelatase CobT-related protein n=1 Tax=Gallicola sp. Sow4_E12 TaxID=3438785 RepID=UPI003F934FB4
MENARKQNITWTASEDYNYDPSYLLFKVYNDDYDFYKFSLAGLAYKYFDMKSIEEFYLLYEEGDLANEDIKMVIQIAIENCLWDYIAKERPGALLYRKNFIDHRIRRYSFHPPKDLSEELEYGFYLIKTNSVPKTFPLAYKLLESVMKIPFQKTSDFIVSLKGILDEYFHINENLKIDYTADKIIEKTKWKEKNKEKNRLEYKKSSFLNPERETLESAELARSTIFTDKNLDEEDKTPHSMDIDDITGRDDIEKIAVSIYGKPILPQYIVEQLEKNLCTDIHDGCRLLITEGLYGDSLNERYRDEIRIQQREENKKHFDDNAVLYRRSISKLSHILEQHILSDLEDQLLVSNSGILDPSRLWRHTYLKDPYIFQREIKDQMGRFTVDILLDNSASQQDRQAQVAAQGYIIASALTKLHIPTRVLGFNNFNHIQILKLYRDYNEPSSKNEKIFEYLASGSNRDGLAIKTALALMDDDSQDNILIILSDGKPNDKVSVGVVKGRKQKAVDYTGDMAIKDTAKEVFTGRNKDKIIFGIFTGNEEDLDQEKRIYGSNFVYIRDIERFSDTVGSFLKKIIDAR